PLAGKPLLQYSIDTALASGLIEQVFVSTDDQAIAQIAVKGGATLIERPAELATDESPEWLSWRHAVEWATEHYGVFDGFV
ncbi:acylneuraminate cytidylyltransferase family protein, partial [Klebsiella pneumoniae]|nr:acylneuraminate cytidylyltransferase family protein [Klebsiella pneumoniae]